MTVLRKNNILVIIIVNKCFNRKDCYEKQNHNVNMKAVIKY